MNGELRVAVMYRKHPSVRNFQRRKRRTRRPTKKNPVEPREAGIDSPLSWTGKIRFTKIFFYFKHILHLNILGSMCEPLALLFRPQRVVLAVENDANTVNNQC